MKKNALIKTEYNAETGTLVFTVGEAGTIEISVGTLPEEISRRAMLHGLVQKVSDAAAMPKSELPDNPVEAARVKLEAMQSVASRLSEGEWSKRSGDGSGPVQGLIFRAFSEYVETMARKRKKTAPDADAVRTKYDAMTRAEQLALRNVPEIGAIIERIKSERGANAVKSVDTDALLGELLD